MAAVYDGLSAYELKVLRDWQHNCKNSYFKKKILLVMNKKKEWAKFQVDWMKIVWLMLPVSSSEALQPLSYTAVILKKVIYKKKFYTLQDMYNKSL